MYPPPICMTTDSNHRQTPDGPRQLILPKAYVTAIATAGGFPLLAAEACPDALSRLCGGLVLTGGDDLTPAVFGAHILNDSVSIDPERDAFELALLRAFFSQNKPILAICRGFQVLNCFLGGDLYQDLPSQLGLHHRGTALRHSVSCAEDSILSRLFGPSFFVNSLHHQAIRRLAPSLRATAYSPDGIIEAFESKTSSPPLWGVQFHPEKLTGLPEESQTPDFSPFFRAFIQVVRSHCA